MSKTVNAGIVTAYGAAVRGGYEGTYEQFCEDLGKLADVLSEFLGFSVSIQTLAEGEQATANYESGILSLGIPRGNTGNGIQSIILNADYTLTVTYTNGQTWTSGSIRGQVGATPHLTIGTVETLPPSQSASATITGTDEDPVLNLGIPKGDTGEVSQSEFDALSDDVDDLSRQLNDETTGLDTKAPVIVETASGAIASFDDGADSMPIRKIVATIEPVQAGTGDPSPDNERPTSGWTGAIFGNTVPAPESGITFPFEPKQAGSGDPSPTNIRPISGYDLTLEDGTHVTVYKGTVTLNEDGTGTLKPIYVKASVTRNFFANATNIEFSAYQVWIRNAFYEYGNGVTYRNRSRRSGGYYCISNVFKVNYFNDTDSISTQYRLSLAKPAGVTDKASFLSFVDSIYESGNTIDFLYQPTDSIPEMTLMVPQLKTFLGEIGYTAQLLPINWEDEAGTVYGGTVTLNEDGSADVVSNRIKNILNGSEEWSLVNGGFYYDRLPISGYDLLSENDWICNKYLVSSAITNSSQVGSKPDKIIFNQNSGTGLPPINLRRVWVKDSAYSSEAEFKAALSAEPIEIVCTLPVPETYHFDNIGQLKTFLGTNNVWCDTGDVEVTYPADTKLYIDGKLAEIQATILENIGG